MVTKETLDGWYTPKSKKHTWLDQEYADMLERDQQREDEEAAEAQGDLEDRNN